MSNWQHPAAPVQALIFDMDGTMIDSMGHHKQSWVAFAAHHGIDIEVGDLMRRTTGRTVTECMNELFQTVLALAAVAQRPAAPGREPQPGSRAALAAAEARAVQRAAADEAAVFREGFREAQKAFLWVTVRAHDNGAHWRRARALGRIGGPHRWAASVGPL